MRFVGFRVVVPACLFAVVVCAGAQTRNPGLWDVTTTMTWQQTPVPGMGPRGPAAGPHTTQVCLTQAQIDKYGAMVPQTNSGCHITNVVMKPGGMTGEMICSGSLTGKGTMESSSADGIHATGNVHFKGSMKMGPNTKPMEWTSKSTAVFKGADCGSVKPVVVPEK